MIMDISCGIELKLSRFKKTLLLLNDGHPVPADLHQRRPPERIKIYCVIYSNFLITTEFRRSCCAAMETHIMLVK